MPSLYVHVPFCIKKCSYCSFYSLSLSGQGKERAEHLNAAYLHGIEQEISRCQKDAPEGVSSLFIGGGTPTLLDEDSLAKLLAILKKGFSFDREIEQSIEGNPGTLNKQKLEILHRFGVNRFSLGIQSFNDSLLRRIGRIHDAQTVRTSIELLRKAGFRNLNFDLMFGLPGQTMELWQETVEEGLRYAPEHFSLYGLMLESGTELFYAGAEDLPDDDLQAEMYEWAVERMTREGYLHYETSNFARPGFECRHNLNYWHGEDYIGLGPGAVSCLSGKRWKNVEEVLEYAEMLDRGLKPYLFDEVEELSPEERMTERIILGLRLAEGLNLKDFKREFGKGIRDIYPSVLEKYISQGMLFIEKEHLKLNPKYVFVANAILADFVQDTP